MSDLQESFNKLKHALENEYAVIPIAEYKIEQAELKALRELHRGIEMVESWLLFHDDNHAEIVYNEGQFLAQTLLPKPRYGVGKTMIEAVMNWKAKHE